MLEEPRGVGAHEIEVVSDDQRGGIRAELAGDERLGIAREHLVRHVERGRVAPLGEEALLAASEEPGRAEDRLVGREFARMNSASRTSASGIIMSPARGSVG